MPQQPDLVQHLLDLTLAQVASHALVILDPNGIILAWLASAPRLFGYSADEVTGQNVRLLFTPEDLEKGLSAWEIKTATDSGESEDDRWQLRKDGGRIWVSGTLTALRDDGGTLKGFAKIMRNQTDQKSQVETLESRAIALDRAHQQKNAFIATLAHELRSPLSAIAGATQLLQSSTDPSDSTFALDTLRRQTHFIGRMIDDLLEVTRAATGKVELHREPCILQDILQQAINTSRPSFDKQTHTLHQLLPEGPIRLHADPVRLHQVFVNLLENAAKYTQSGGTVWVKVTLEGHEAVVRVRDTGIGISPDIMPHVFDLFTQAQFASRARDGLGIGLSVVKDFVSLHGGSVQATSDGLGKGSEFTVRLPLPASPDLPTKP